MSARRRWLERGKSLLIVLLLISAVVLLRQSAYYAVLQQRLPGADSAETGGTAAETGSEGVSARLQPLALLVSSADGARSAAAWDAQAISAMFESFSAALGEALGSAGAPQAVEQSQWQAALTADAVFVDLACPYPLPLLAQWLGTSTPIEGEPQARLLALSGSGDAVHLYYLNTADGQHYRCTTAVSASALRSKMADHRRGNAIFAFEDGGLARLAPDTVVLDALPAVPVITGGSAVDNGFPLDSFFAAADMDPAAIKQYTESDGTRVYLENGRTVRIDPRGLITLTAPDASDASGRGMSGAVTVAESFLRTFSGGSGAAQLSFGGVEQVDEEQWLVRFDYYVNGIPVSLPGRQSAAAVTVRHGAVSRAELCPRQYTVGTELTELLPMKLSAAAATAGSGQQELRLVYIDSGTEVRCAWVR